MSTISDALPLRRDEHAVAVLVARRRQVHADRRAEPALVLPEELGLVFEAVAVGVAEQPDVAVVAQRDERAVGPVLDVVDVRSGRAAAADGEARHEHLHRRRVGHGDERSRRRRRRPAAGSASGRRAWRRGTRGPSSPRRRSATRSKTSTSAMSHAREPADLLRAGAVGVVAGPDRDLGEAQRGGRPRPLAGRRAVHDQPDRLLRRRGLRAGRACRTSPPGFIRFRHPPKPAALDVQLGEPRRAVRPHVDGEAGLVVAAVGGVEREEAAEAAGVASAGRRRGTTVNAFSSPLPAR